ncbi:MAG: hypothetical protein AAGH99_06370 [Planctomycetota bacterium]
MRYSITRSVSILSLAILIWSTTGCAWYTYRDVAVRVLDGQTGEPISGLDFHLIPIHALYLNSPHPLTGTTNEYGIETGRLANTFGYYFTQAPTPATLIAYNRNYPAFPGFNTLSSRDRVRLDTGPQGSQWFELITIELFPAVDTHIDTEK